MHRIILTVPLLVTLSAACVEPEATVATDPAFAQPCPKLWGCGENSPMMGPFHFHELNTAGLPNDENVRLLNLQIGVNYYQPKIVNNSRLVAYDPVGGGTLSGAALTGGHLNLATPDGNYRITIKKVSPQASSFTVFWVGPATPIETYEMTYTKIGLTEPVPLCDNPPERISGEGPTRMWVRRFETILFSGDRYDADSKDIIATTPLQAGNWFNLACAGTSIAKLYLTRHTFASSLSTHPSSWGRRQAMLRMYVSDVCGTGRPFTEKGTPLHWQNVSGWSTFDGTEYAHESLWSPDGAICLDTHRRFDQFLTDIKDECGGALPPPCPSWLPSGATYVSSAVPFAPPP